MRAVTTSVFRTEGHRQSTARREISLPHASMLGTARWWRFRPPQLAALSFRSRILRGPRRHSRSRDHTRATICDPGHGGRRAAAYAADDRMRTPWLVRRGNAAMDATYFRDKAETCLRLAKGLSWNNPARGELIELAEEFQRQAEELDVATGAEQRRAR